MSIAHALSTELTNLISQTKRRNADLRPAAEAALEYLRQNGSNEKDLISALRNNFDFITPFVIACFSHNTKSCSSAIQCFNILIPISAIPEARIKEVLKSFTEATSLGEDIQLKILQCLPSLFENYGPEMKDDTVVVLLQICSILHTSNKVQVANTSLATLQQLLIHVYDKMATEDEAPETAKQKTHEVPTNSGDDDSKILISPSAYDGLRIFVDLCSMCERQRPTFLQFTSLPETFGLEVLESILTNHSVLFQSHAELTHVLRTKCVPLLLRAFSDQRDFSVTVRVTRILYLLIRRQLSILKVECEVTLTLFTHMLNPENAPLWKRILCMEVLQGVFSEYSLVEEIFASYDDNQDEHYDCVKNILAAFETISSQQPDVIGLGEFSSIYNYKGSDQESGKVLENGFHTSSLSHIGISRSLVYRVPCIDLLDKSDPPALHPNHLYYLVLMCVCSLSESFANSVLRSSQSEQLAIRERKSHQVSVRFVQSSWPILISIYSIYFRTTMEGNLFTSLVRAVQKFAQAANLLAVFDGRDAAMTLLMHNSVSMMNHTARAILCARAQMILAIFYGKDLGSSWKIIIETLHRASIYVFSLKDGGADGIRCFASRGTEFASLDTSVKKLVDVSTGYEEDAYGSIIEAISQYHSNFLYELVKELFKANIARFSNKKTIPSWVTISNYFVSAMKEDSRACIVLNDVIYFGVLDTRERLTSQLFLKSELDAILKLDGPNKTMLHVACIDNLRRILDECGTSLTGWSITFEIIDTAFASGDEVVIRTGFECLQLICTDFLQSLSAKELESLLNTLSRFSNQTLDLNISFTSISLFWMLSDHIRKLAGNDEDLEKALESEEEVQNMDRQNFNTMWISVLLSLSHISQDSRAQVRNGAIQTLFRVFESQGKTLSAKVWQTCQYTVFKQVMNVGLDKNLNIDIEWVDTVAIVLSSLSSVFSAFAGIFFLQGNFEELWFNLMNYYDTVLQFNSAVLNKRVYESFGEVVSAFNELPLSAAVSQRACDFWTSQNTNMTGDIQDVQKALCALVPIFEIIQVLPNNELDINKATETLITIGSFDSLPDFYQDHDHLTQLQKLVLEQVARLDSVNLESKVYAQFVQLPFIERPKKEKCTFIALCNESLKQLREMDFSVLNANDTKRVVKSLLVVMDVKFDCPRLSAKLIQQSGNLELWQQAVTVFVRLIKQTVNLNQLWPEVCSAVRCILGGDLANESYEQTDLDAYTEITEVITSKEFPPESWLLILDALFKESFIYPYSGPVSEDETLTAFGSTKSVIPLPRSKIAYHCLRELLKLALNGNEQVASKALGLFLERSHFVLYRYVADQPLRELKTILSLLIEYCEDPSAETEKVDTKLHSLLYQAIVVSANQRELLEQIEKLLFGLKSKSYNKSKNI